MSFLFQIQGRVVFPNPETILISPFKEIWERDKSESKEGAIMEFTFIEFMTSMMKSNPYREYPEDKKEEILKKDIIKDEDWQPDDLVKAAMDKIIEWQNEGSISYKYWMSNKEATEKMIEFFNSFDINERNPKTLNPIYKPRDIISAVGDAEKVLKTLDSLKTKVDEELYETSRNKSGKEISPFSMSNKLK